MGAGGQLPARPPGLREVGVTLTPHVHNFEMMKIRILNGGRDHRLSGG
jgi:mannitol-1-phosphate/altronate dehydrogenase